jgi:trafficking protein particle complex subunit 11
MPRQDWRYDILGSLDGLGTVTFKPAVVIRDQDVHSFLSATFTFEHGEGKVGESCISQLTVTSLALPVSAPVTMAEIRIFFEGSMRWVTLRHTAGTDAEKTRSDGILYSSVALHEPPAHPDAKVSSRDPRSTALLGEADLSFPPGKTKVFEFVCPLRESGEARATSATFVLNSELFDLDYIVTFNRTTMPDVWWCQKLGRKRLVRVDPHAMNVLPKPPKMDLRFAALQDQYYTNEFIKLQLDISNGEDDESIAKLVVHIAGDQPPPFVLGLAQSAHEDDDPDTAEAGTQYLELGSIASAGSTSAVIEIPPVMLPAIYDVTVELSYHLFSDMETPISKTTTIRLLVVSPFEANYDFSPRLDMTPWPSFFSHDENISIEQGEESLPKATGLAQKWCLTTRYASFAAEDLIIEDVDISILSLNGGITCTTIKSNLPDYSFPHATPPNSISERQFSVLTRKLSLDDRRSASLDLLLVIKWQRPSASSGPDSTINTTHLPIPRLLVASSEPRVLASVVYSPIPDLSPPLLTLSYTIENPSMHFLTFGIVMNPSEHFAFSGIKQGTVQLLPLSRRTVKFRLLPLFDVGASVKGDGRMEGKAPGGSDQDGEWIRINFVVRDRYFQKVLKVVATEGMRTDKEGILLWVPASIQSIGETEVAEEHD